MAGQNIANTALNAGALEQAARQQQLEAFRSEQNSTNTNIIPNMPPHFNSPTPSMIAMAYGADDYDVALEFDLSDSPEREEGKRRRTPSETALRGPG